MADPAERDAQPTEPERKAPRRVPRRAVELPEYLPARMLNEFVYCPRLFFYEWVEGVFAHSADTIEGSLRHEKLETKADALPPPAATGEGTLKRSVRATSPQPSGCGIRPPAIPCAKNGTPSSLKP